MLVNDLLAIAMATASLAIGYVLGRARPSYDRPHVPDPEPESESTHPYRDAAARLQEPATRTRLHGYCNYENKVWLTCPACGGAVTEIEVCKCAEVECDNDMHLHVYCTHCSLRFAMETREVWLARTRKVLQISGTKAN